MIGNITKNSSFSQTLRYVLGKTDAKLIGGNIFGRSTAQLIREFEISRQLNPDIVHPVYHLSLSLPHQDSLSDQQFSDLANDYFQRLIKALEGEPTTHQFVVVRHRDQQHEHIHIVASRIDLTTTKVLSDSRDYFKSQAIIRELEEKYQLTPIPSSWEKGQRSTLHPDAVTRLEESGQVYGIQYLQGAIDESIQSFSSPATLVDLTEALMERGISVSLHANGDSNLQGISYGAKGMTIAGHRLGNQYSLPGLQRRGIAVQPEHIADINRLFEQAVYLRQSAKVFIQIAKLMRFYKASTINGKRYTFKLSMQAEQPALLIFRKKQKQAEEEPPEPILKIVGDQFSLQSRLTQEDFDRALAIEKLVHSIKKSTAIQQRSTVIQSLIDL